MTWTIIFIVLLGLVVGSFLNVCIFRLPRRESVVSPRSRCFHCHQPIAWRDNVPLLSYLLLGGKCRRCGHAIHWIYPVVETLTAVCFVLLLQKFGLTIPFLVNALFIAILIVLSFIDLNERLLPNVITVPGMAAGFVLSPWQSREFFQGDPFLGTPETGVFALLHSLLGLFLGGGILWLVAWGYFRMRRIEGLGMGDVKMMALVGAFVGWRFAWMTIFIGSIIGSIMGGLYILLLDKGRRYELPFGTFLGSSAILTTLYGASWLRIHLGQS